MQRYLFWPLLAVLALVPVTASADDWVTDLRLGILAHDMPILGSQREHGADLNAELDFAALVPADQLSSIDPAVRWMLRPAPDLGIEANTNGYTSQVYFGLIWTVNLDNRDTLWPDHAVFLSIGLGPAFNNGEVHANAGNRLSLGSNVLFHPSLELGYRMTPVTSISVYFDHSSNAGLSRYNAGLDNIGMRLGIHF